jgi:hypothetical protein
MWPAVGEGVTSVNARLFWCATAIVVAAASNATAARKGDPEPGDPPEEPTPRPPRPPKPIPEPVPVPAPVLYGRESSLPLCTWGHYSEESSFQRFLWDFEENWYGAWTCRIGDVHHDDTCTFGGAPDYKPTNAQYALGPRNQPDNYTADLVWPDGSALYGVWGIGCMSSGASGGADDILTSSNVEGGFGDEFAFVDGGTVEHVRPGLVRGSVMMMLPPGGYLPRKEGDLVLAIQIYGDNGWEDFATRTFTVETTLTTFEVEAVVPELTDVRLAVRADATRGHLGVGYDLRDARIFVETCIPDQNQPGTCLGD